MDSAPYDPSYEEHGILGALKLRVGGLFGSAAAHATPVAIDKSYDQFNAASLLSQEDAAANPENLSGAARSPTGTGEVPRGEEQVRASTATAALEADEPGAETNEVVTSSRSPSRRSPADEPPVVSPTQGSPRPQLASEPDLAPAGAASADEVAAIAADGIPAPDFAPVRERSPATHTPVRAAAAATASAAIAAVNAAAAMAANANPSPQASTPRVSEVEDLALGLAPASPGAPEAASNAVPEQPATPPAAASPPRGSTPIRHRVACTPVGAAAAATASAAVAAVVAAAVAATPADACAVQVQPRNEPSEQPPASPLPPLSLQGCNEAGAQPMPEEDKLAATQPAATQLAATQPAATQSLDEFCSRVGEGSSPTQQAEPPSPSDAHTPPSEEATDALDESSAAAPPPAHVAVTAEEDSQPEDGETEHEGQQARTLTSSHTYRLVHLQPPTRIPLHPGGGH
jgi:hypothetical protein